MSCDMDRMAAALPVIPWDDVRRRDAMCCCESMDFRTMADQLLFKHKTIMVANESRKLICFARSAVIFFQPEWSFQS